MGARGARSGRGGSGAVHEPPPSPRPSLRGGCTCPKSSLCAPKSGLCAPKSRLCALPRPKLCTPKSRFCVPTRAAAPRPAPTACPPRAPRCLFPSISGRSPQNCRRLWFFQPLPSLSPLGAVAPALPVLGAALPSCSLGCLLPPAPCPCSQLVPIAALAHPGSFSPITSVTPRCLIRVRVAPDLLKQLPVL